jgi:hypothetical protein
MKQKYGTLHSSAGPVSTLDPSLSTAPSQPVLTTTPPLSRETFTATTFTRSGKPVLPHFGTVHGIEKGPVPTARITAIARATDFTTGKVKKMHRWYAIKANWNQSNEFNRRQKTKEKPPRFPGTASCFLLSILKMLESAF